MPRTTCRPSEQQQQLQQQQQRVANGNNCNGNNDGEIAAGAATAATTTNTTSSSNNNNNNNNHNNSSSSSSNSNNNNTISGNIKQEFDATPPVCHRKSERRRVARDIFLVFEEQPARRRGRGARGKSTRTKQKFGHLKVANTPRINKNLLREIKSEPKCTTAATAAALQPPLPPPPLQLPPPVVTEPPTAAVQPKEIAGVKQTKAKTAAAVKLETKTAYNAAQQQQQQPHKLPPPSTSTTTTTLSTSQLEGSSTLLKVAVNGVEEQEKEKAMAMASSSSSLSSLPVSTGPSVAVPTSTPTTPSVNPIFLWVKQDDTRIVEVRCEDYDKRNRIRLTKTTNGWRSMPRTDASSTRIVKFFHSAATPLMKVKREVYDRQSSLEVEPTEPEPQSSSSSSLAQNLLQDWDDSVSQMPTDRGTSGGGGAGGGVETNTDGGSDGNDVDNLTAVIEDVMVLPPSNELAEDEVEEEDDDEVAPPQPRQLTAEAAAAAPPLPPEEEEAMTATDMCFDALLDSETNASTKATKTSTNTSANTPTYQSSMPSPMELQLCPKTGLFLPKGAVCTTTTTTTNAEESSKPQSSLVEQQQQQSGLEPHTTESLDANTKNLKDLLDDADLLQNCSSDNGSNGADLLDSLVKRSCENNLMQENNSNGNADGGGGGGGDNGGGDGGRSARSTASAEDALSSFCVPDLDKDLPHILEMDNDNAPKCLSFNEAGEIEGLNGELFHETHSHAFGIDALPALTETPQQTPTLTPMPTPTPTPPDHLIKESMEQGGGCGASASGGVEETPKDLSYKKREEVCPPSESRSQCAVTSSSDILKSPERLELAANSIPAEVETIKHLILEQFLKLNALNQLPSSGGASAGANPVQLGQQAEPMDLVGKTRGDKLETVVIEDDEEEEEDAEAEAEEAPPLKKRSKSSIKMDKDPDALTQLKMLIANPQWKVPDPILVPKDRLGAVLASPAREIPLLLTTRPELRLPEAFAYPEIIQNPNILVVTMEQLEAILKNEVEQAKTAKQFQMTTDVAATLVDPPAAGLTNKQLLSTTGATSKHQQQHQQLPQKTLQSPAKAAAAAVAAVAAPPPSSLPPAVTTPVANSPAADSSVSTEMNATTLALLQQMLWLPYFGQLSQEFFKTLKDPIGLQRKFMSNLLPFYNSQQMGMQQLDELYKHCLLKQKQSSSAEEAAVASKPTPPPSVLPTPNAATPTNFNGFGGNPMELALMQKLLQPQLPHFLNWGEQPTTCKSTEQQQQHHHSEHKRARRSNDDVVMAETKPPATAAPPPPPTSTSTAAATTVAVGTSAAAATTPSVAPPEHKPRLTCKSLSNLLEPESNTVPLLNVPFDGLRRASLHKSLQDSHGKEAVSGRTLRSSKACVTYNPMEQSKQQQQQQLLLNPGQQRKRGNMMLDAQHQQHQQQLHQQQQQQHQQNHHHHQQQQQQQLMGDPDANSALWHPLFGSNSKQGYNSPWQWTTVTATGE